MLVVVCEALSVVLDVFLGVFLGVVIGIEGFVATVPTCHSPCYRCWYVVVHVVIVRHCCLVRWRSPLVVG